MSALLVPARVHRRDAVQQVVGPGAVRARDRLTRAGMVLVTTPGIIAAYVA